MSESPDTEYTPTIEQVRQFFAASFPRDIAPLRKAEAFDRWLAARDAEVAARALDDFAGWWENKYSFDDAPGYTYEDEPIVSRYLRARATAIREGNTE
jgi:hypothetical protein